MIFIKYINFNELFSFCYMLNFISPQYILNRLSLLHLNHIYFLFWCW